LLPLGEQARIFDHLCEAEALAERLGDDQRLGRIACYLCIYLSNMEEHDRAIGAGQRALALATTSGAFDVQVVAQTYLGAAYYRVGDFQHMSLPGVLRMPSRSWTRRWSALPSGAT